MEGKIVETEKIQQRHYGLIEFDNSEKDIVQIWQHQSLESNVIQIEREHLPDLIATLCGITTGILRPTI